MYQPDSEELKVGSQRQYTKVESQDPTFNSVTINTTLTLSGFTQGSVFFAGPAGLVSQDNTNFFFNDTTNQLYVANMKIGSLSGVLKASTGVVAGSATTTDLPEGTNLYFTNERVDDEVATLIQNGTGITWTYNDPANTLTGNVSLAAFTTDSLPEGSTNLYFTNARARSAISAGNDISYNSSTGVISHSILRTFLLAGC